MIPRDIQALFDKLQPLYGRKLEPLRSEYQLNPKSRPEIEFVLSNLISKTLGDRNPLTVPSKGRVQGRYLLGEVTAADKMWDSFGLNEDEWIQHLGIFGRSGSGKTNVGFLILKELVTHGKPFLVCDWKRNYRDLLQRPEFTNLRILTVGRDIAPFHFNPLAPPAGTEPKIFLKKLIEILMHVYWLGDGVAYLLQKGIDDVYRQRGVYSGQSEDFPTLFDVRDWLRKYKARGREGQWMDSTRRVMETLCFGQIGRVMKTKSNAEFERVLNSEVILELDALSNSDKTFLIEAMLLWLHHKRMCEREREKFKHAILIEEAHHVLLKRKESKETVMDVILREIRELGESIIFLDQHPSLVSIPSLGNSYCTVAMNLKHGNDVSALARAMVLNNEEKEFLGKLLIGEAVVKLQGRWVKPFHVRFPHFAVEKGRVRDEDLKKQNVGVSVHSEEVPRQDRDRKEIPVVPGTDRDKGKSGITAEERELIEEVMAFPTVGIKERMERLGVSTRGMYSLISSCEIVPLPRAGSGTRYCLRSETRR